MSYTDANLAPGYYYYTVVAQDMKGDMGPSSATSANITTAGSCTPGSVWNPYTGAPCTPVSPVHVCPAWGCNGPAPITTNPNANPTVMPAPGYKTY